jgi:hypothetical protein
MHIWSLGGCHPHTCPFTHATHSIKRLPTDAAARFEPTISWTDAVKGVKRLGGLDAFQSLEVISHMYIHSDEVLDITYVVTKASKHFYRLT